MVTIKSSSDLLVKTTSKQLLVKQKLLTVQVTFYPHFLSITSATMNIIFLWPESLYIEWFYMWNHYWCHSCIIETLSSEFLMPSSREWHYRPVHLVAMSHSFYLSSINNGNWLRSGLSWSEEAATMCPVVSPKSRKDCTNLLILAIPETSQTKLLQPCTTIPFQHISRRLTTNLRDTA